MAFRLPDQPPPRPQQQQQHQPHQSYLNIARPSPPHASPASTLPSTFQHPDEDDSREWVLFSPSTQRHSTTYTTSTERTPRLSDFGSLGTAPRSSAVGANDQEEDIDHNQEDLLEEEENAELDSLEDGLHAFREPSTYPSHQPDAAQLHQSDPAMLPAHDGLGTFPASSMNVQEQLWQHERFNPRRRGEMRHRRRSSVQRHLDSIDKSQPRDSEHDRWQRIEQWRMEQSRALLQEIEKETRHRRQSSRNSRASGRPRAPPRISTSEIMGDVSVEATASTSKGNDSSVGSGKKAAPQDEEESFWRRITRKVIRDLIGLDDSLLSVILGESLVPIAEEDGNSKDQTTNQQTENHAKKRKASTILEPDLPHEMDEMLKSITAPHQGDAWWQEKLLGRIARELGILVHEICEHPSAFTTSMLASPSQEYAGISTARFNSASTASAPRSKRPSESASRSNSKDIVSIHSPKFTPTLQDATNPVEHAESWEIQEEQHRPANTISSGAHPTPEPPAAGESVSETAHVERDTEYWERELDIGMVFRYLRNRLADKTSFARNPAHGHSSHKRVDSPSYRAAIIRQHHPLVARAHDLARSQRPVQWQTHSNSTATSPTGFGHAASPILHRRARRSSSSCASQSTKYSVSTRRTLASGSSRHYWDIGGSVGSGSAVITVGGAGGGMGSWGDV